MTPSFYTLTEGFRAETIDRFRVRRMPYAETFRSKFVTDTHIAPNPNPRNFLLPALFLNKIILLPRIRVCTGSECMHIESSAYDRTAQERKEKPFVIQVIVG
jgi:hypothetical protein